MENKTASVLTVPLKKVQNDVSHRLSGQQWVDHVVCLS